MDFNKIKLFANTIKFLKPIQIYYRLFYFFRDYFNQLFIYKHILNFLKKIKLYNFQENKINLDIPKYRSLRWFDVTYNLKTYHGQNLFKFLNISHDFKNKIDWNFKENQDLWIYNLNYFEYLNQRNITFQEGLKLIEDFCANYSHIKVGKNPFPTSLRIINWIKFICKHKIYDSLIINILAFDVKRLSKNIEFHLLGNHLLENAFALYFAGNFFGNEKLLKISKNIIKKQLNEQILEDGGHFELSPMYHSIMLYRVLDCINLLELNKINEDKSFIIKLKSKAELMMGWLQNIRYKNGSLPLFNDSARGICPNSSKILNYFKKLNLVSNKRSLSDSGYRKFSGKNYEFVADVGAIGPSYQSGHGHADTFNFEFHINKIPIIVDTGISTYQIGPTRDLERSTKSHNTVSIEDRNSSQVWSSFRVGERANVWITEDTNKQLKAFHDGYVSMNSVHTRCWKFTENYIIISDNVTNKNHSSIASFHFHPDINFIKVDDKNITSDKFTISFTENITHILINEYFYNEQFNKPKLAKKLCVKFKENLCTKIYINGNNNSI